MKSEELHTRCSVNYPAKESTSHQSDELSGCRATGDNACHHHLATGSPANMACETPASPWLRIEIDAEILLQLLKGRRLCAADMRCLDCRSKHCLQRLLLQACAQNMVEFY
jgi:hypothetical protein